MDKNDKPLTLAQAVGKRIQELREEAGYETRVVFAKKIGLSSSTVSSVENGDNWLSEELAPIFANFLKVPVAAFYPGFRQFPDSLDEANRALGELIEAVMEVKPHQRKLVVQAFKSKSGFLAALKDAK